MKMPKFIPLCGAALLILTLTGCEAFVRKFTRKPKQENLPTEEMVLVPQEYQAPQMSKEETYRKFFLYWKSWQDELMDALTYGSNSKKQIGCANEAINNLKELRGLLAAGAQERLDVYIGRLGALRDKIKRDRKSVV